MNNYDINGVDNGSLSLNSIHSDSFFTNMPCGYYRCSDEEGFPFTYLSNTFLEMVGWTQEEIATMFDNKYINMVHPDDKERFLHLYSDQVTTNNTSTLNDKWRLNMKSGYTWVLDFSSIHEVDGKTVYQGFIIDFSYYVHKESEVAKQLEKVISDSDKDYLTGLMNRKALEFDLKIYLSNNSAKGAFLLVDIDSFKEVNDLFGHLVGDELLIMISSVLKSTFRDCDLISRIGGDEFAVFMRGTINPEIIKKKAELLIQNGFKRLYTDDKRIIDVTLSIGIALLPNDATSIDEVYKKADEALYFSKNRGRHCYTMYNEMITGSVSDNTFERTIGSLRTDVNGYDCMNILDSLKESGVYVISESDHKVLYFNKHFLEMVPNVRIGDRCDKIWNKYCDNCPLNSIGNRQDALNVFYDDVQNTEVEITATRMLWREKTKAFLIKIIPNKSTLVNRFVINKKANLVSSDFTNGMYAINKDYEIVSYSLSVKEKFPSVSEGKKCYMALWGRTSKCTNCPIDNPSSDIHSTVDVIPVSRNGIERNGSILVFRRSLFEEPNFMNSRESLMINDAGILTGTLGYEFSRNEEVLSAQGFNVDRALKLQDMYYSSIFDLLMENGGVGIIAGFFDDRLSLRFISSIAISLFGYQSIENFHSTTKDSLLSLVSSDYDKSFLLGKLSENKNLTWTMQMKGAGNLEAIFTLNKRNVRDDEGRDTWVISVRKATEKFRDILTGGYSRKGLEFYINRMITEGIDLTNYSILYLNVDSFKAVNELYSSADGDELLKTIYSITMNSFLQPEAGARLESDHFAFLVKNENLNMDKLPSILRFDWNNKNYSVKIMIRCGIYYITNPIIPVPRMIDRAKLAKHYIKDESAKPWSLYDNSMSNKYISDAEVLSEYEEALKNNEFVVYYQPVIDVAKGTIASAEALIRWNKPQKGVLSPIEFVPALERTGFISSVDNYVIDRVYEFLARRNSEGKPLVPISVNLSLLDFNDKPLLSNILTKIEDEKVAPNYLRFELTETSYQTLESSSEDFLRKIRKLGTKILLDDFGSGYTSFGTIQDYAFDILKIDKSFMKKIETTAKTRLILQGLIMMAHSVGVKIVAEGVETEKQLEFLKDKGCDFIQGYYYAKPLSEKDFIEYLDRNFK